MLILTISIQHHTEGHTGASVIRQDRELKDIEIGKEVILSLFTNNMVVYMENPTENTKTCCKK